jgi:hypothetical protein
LHGEERNDSAGELHGDLFVVGYFDRNYESFLSHAQMGIIRDFPGTCTFFLNVTEIMSAEVPGSLLAGRTPSFG